MSGVCLASQPGGQQSGGEFEPWAVAVRPIPAHRRAPKLSDDRPGSFTFRIYEAAVRGLRRSAITGPSWSAQNFSHWAALDDWFTAANLNSALARPGHNRPLVIRSEFSLLARLG